jgi:hypothetical protein
VRNADVLAVALLLAPITSSARPIASEGAACTALKQRVAKSVDQKMAGPATDWRCDFIVKNYQPKDYYVASLHSGLPCPTSAACSSLIGWYAVRRADGKVIEWDLAQDVPGKQL